MNKIIKYLKKPKLILIKLIDIGLFSGMRDEEYLKLIYKLKLNKELNLDNPKTFNEKMQWLKLYDKNDLYTKLVDKYEVKEYVKKIIGEEYIIPTLGVWKSFDEINFDELPEQFVLKCTHDSGGVVICNNKKVFDLKKAKKKINRSLKKNYFYLWREWPYKEVEPRIIAEKYMIDSSGRELKDYKFFCFNGKAKIVLVCSNRFKELEETFLDENWNILPFKRPNHSINENVQKPLNFEKMKEYAEKLAEQRKFVRIDFYESNEKMYFGEITFYPASGLNGFEPEEYDEKLGKMIKLD